MSGAALTLALAAGASLLGGDFAWPGAAVLQAQELASLDRGQRRRAIERLAERREPEVRAGLVTLLGDADRDVRLAAAKALARAGAPEATDAAVRWVTGTTPGDRPLGLDVLREVAGPLPPAARRAVERSLRDSEPTIRFLAIDALSRRDPRASFVAIAAACEDDNREVRLRAIQLLGRSHDGRAALALLPRLADADRQVRVSAIQGLAATGDKHAGPALMRQLSDPVDEIRMAAIEALGRVRVDDALPSLIALARRRPADDVTRQAALALGDIGSPQAIAVLIDLLREPPLVDDARQGLRRAGDAAIPALLVEAADGPPTGSAAAVSLLGQIGAAGARRPERRVVKALAAIVERRGGAVLAALEALGALGDPDAVATILRAAADPSPELRRSSYAALVRIADDRAVVAVARGVADRDPEVRRLALRLAVATGARDAAVLGAVTGRLADGDATVGKQAARTLLDLHASARGATAALLARIERDPGDAIAADALEATAGPQDDAALLASAARARGPARGAIARAFAAAHAAQPLRDRAAIELLIGLLGDGGANAESAAEALGEARAPDDLQPAILRAFDEAEPGVRARLCAALAAAGDAAARARLARALDDDREAAGVRAAAAWAAARALRSPPTATSPPASTAPAAAPGATDSLRQALERAAEGGGVVGPPVAANARAALARAGPPGGPRDGDVHWTAARAIAPDGAPLPRRWISLASTADGPSLPVWVETGLDGRARAAALPPGPYAVTLVDPDLEARALE